MKGNIFRKILVIFVIFLFIGMISNSLNGNTVLIKSTVPTFNSKTLYVGGIGPGNYTSIQVAIDDASDGDSVFVYNDSSPYFENILVNKSINLIGEDRDTTVVDARGRGTVVSISSDYVNIQGFIIQNSGNHFNDSGIFINSSSCSISFNIIKSNMYGIFLKRSSDINIYENIIINNSMDGLYMALLSDSVINNNTFIANRWNAISLENSVNNIFSNNIIIHTEWIGIELFDSSNNNMIFNNFISETLDGCAIHIDRSCFNNVYRNNITNNMFGIILRFSYQNCFYQNNLKNNTYYNAAFTIINRSHRKNIWKENFWDRPRLLPKPIIGIRILVLKNSIIIPIPIPCLFNFDWHPARKPYDI